jgi:hypothetical protein
MHAETAFVLVYSAVLLAAAAGLHLLGKITRYPSRSRSSLNRDGADDGAEQRSGNPRWPHDESSRLHTVIGLTAVAAAIVLLVVEAIRHHRPIELLALGAVCVLALAKIRLLANAFPTHQDNHPS